MSDNGKGQINFQTEQEWFQITSYTLKAATHTTRGKGPGWRHNVFPQAFASARQPTAARVTASKLYLGV